jgi:hypothetical protein
MAGIDSYTKLMLHMNGTDESTTFTDSSAEASAFTARGAAQIDTAQAKFNQSGLFNGTTSYVTSNADNSGWHFASGDFTIDFWAYLDEAMGSAQRCLAGLSGSTNDWASTSGHEWIAFLYTDSKFYFVYNKALAPVAIVSTNPVDVDAGWHHFAIVRNGETITLYVDGTSVGSGAESAAIYTVAAGTPHLTIGASGVESAPWKGWMDEVCISKGVARWTANFTPPAAEYIPEAISAFLSISAKPAMLLPLSPIVIPSSLSTNDMFLGNIIQVSPITLSKSILASLKLSLICPPVISSMAIAGSPHFNPVLALSPIQSNVVITAVPTQFTIQNPTLLYFFTLTGAPDGLADIVIPIESFQARHRSGDPTYLSVVIPGIDNAAAIMARSNGEMVIHMSKAMGGVIYHTEEIIRVGLETIRTDEGSTNESITLDGHKTTTYQAKTVALEGVNYHSVNDGKKLYRCAAPNIYLRPGDTATYGGDSFTVGLVTYYVNADQQSMEVSEVA